MNQKRPPIVTVLGHVDHGKTSLLDRIRKSSVTATEAGGITQSIGAYSATTPTGQITFIDTPGHAAFSMMRERGANVCDIAILVVASDDGIKPQTKEAIEIIKNAKIPFIVALTKSDLPASNPDKAKAELASHGILFDDAGGDIPCVLVSSKTGAGIETLLETINILSEVNGISSSPESPLSSVVIETNKAREGVVVSMVVKEGTIKVGQDVYCEGEKIRIRALVRPDGERVSEVGPGFAALVLGFAKEPAVGAIVSSSSEQAVAKVAPQAKPQTSAQDEDESRLKIILKTKNQGSAEAILASLPDGVTVHESSLGEVTENDVFMAKTTNSIIVCFEIKPTTSVKKLSDSEKVNILTFNIIYELFQKLDELVHASDTVLTGKAQVLGTFPFENKKVAGIKVSSGKISIGDTLIFFVDGNEKEVRVTSMRKYKDKITEAKEGQECGIIVEPQVDFQVGDILVAIKKN